MSDAHDPDALLAMALGPQPGDDADGAAADATTAPEEDAEVEELSLDEALAALDGDDAPPADEEWDDGETAEQDLAAGLTPEQINALVTEVTQRRAFEAAVRTAAQDAQYDGIWEEHIENGRDWYEGQREQIRALGRQQGRTQDEIDLAIYRRVELGIGLVDADGSPVLGANDWELETERNRRTETMRYQASKSAPSALDALTTKYSLSAEDRTYLAQFVGHASPQVFEGIAYTLWSKNQSLGGTLKDITTQANRNVARTLSRAPAPGTPGASPRRAGSYVYTHEPHKSHDETRLFARQMGLLRGTER